MPGSRTKARTRSPRAARREDGFLVEDDYDGEFRYDQQPVGAMQALAPDRVVFAGSTSKTLAPGMRLGWLVVPAALRGALLEVIAGGGAPVSACTGCTPTATGESPAETSPRR